MKMIIEKSSTVSPCEDFSNKSLADILEDVQNDNDTLLDFSNLRSESEHPKKNDQHNNFMDTSSEVPSQKPSAVQSTSKSSSRPSAMHQAHPSPEAVTAKPHPSEISKVDALSDLLAAAAESKAKKPKEKQVWLAESLYRKIEMLNIKHGKQVPTKYLVDAILQQGLDQLLHG